MIVSLTIAARFNGPPTSGNGGYVSGLLARQRATPASSATTVTLRRPPPLDVPLAIDVAAGDVLELRSGSDIVAEAVPAAPADDPPLVDRVPLAAVAEAEHAYRGMAAHPFPTCFVCGPRRRVGDGLRLRPGPVPGLADTTACTWAPNASLADATSSAVRAEFVWAVLDCPGGWTFDIVGRPMVLGRMTGIVDALPSVGDRCTVMGRLLTRQGRKAFTATTLYDSGGVVLGRARATWLDVDPRTFAGGG